MSSRVELVASINQYKSQLIQVQTALASCKQSEVKNLENLQSDLSELLSLTEEQLNELNESDNEDDPFEAEMKLFLSEIRNAETDHPNDSNSDDVEHFATVNRIEAVKKELNAIIGKKVSAPWLHTWGSKSSHNAFVCSLDDITDYDDINLDNVKIKVLFTNPTHREMVPCSYFLDGICKFEADQCHFSHGELVLFSELKECKDPDFTLLEKARYPVLAKQSDRLWHRGRVISSNFNEKTCKIKLEQSSKEIDCDFHDVLPIQEDDAIESTDSESDDDEYNEIQHQALINNTLLNPTSDQALGEWEKYTKGFGSKMMQKFGYVVGTGLGNGKGIVVPIQIQIFPPGKSLDHCLELRERSNGDKDLFSVERKMKKQQRKQEQKNIRAYERDRQSSNVFNFINENVFANLNGCTESETGKATQSSNVVKNDFKNHSIKNLNVAGFKIAEDIKKLEKDIQNVKDSMARQHCGTPMYKKLSSQLSAKNVELTNLKKSEKSVATEQIFRKDKSKLTIF